MFYIIINRVLKQIFLTVKYEIFLYSIKRRVLFHDIRVRKTENINIHQQRE
jgi:hypothetical protein